MAASCHFKVQLFLLASLDGEKLSGDDSTDLEGNRDEIEDNLGGSHSSLASVMTDTNKTMSCFLQSNIESQSVLAGLSDKLMDDTLDKSEITPLLKSLCTEVKEISTNVKAILEALHALQTIVTAEVAVNQKFRPQVSKEITDLSSLLDTEHKR